MKNGYVGRIARINLSSKEVTDYPLDECVLRKYISGRGLGAKILYDINPPGIDSTDPENTIVLTTGVLTGTASLFSSRTNITTKSPLTGMICMGNCGGFFGPELKFAGYDGLVITGKAASLSYLEIRNNKIEIRACEDLVGKGCPDTEEGLIKRTDRRARALCIGPAAERGVKVACVYGDHRFVGRGGTGAVFASKHLKGIVVRGTLTDTVPVFNQNEFAKIVEEQKKLFKENEFFQLWREYGTPFIVSPMNDLGILGTKNYTKGFCDFHEQINGDALKSGYVSKKITCHRCPVACISLSEVKNGKHKGAHCRGPEYETIYAFGSTCGNSSLPTIILADQLCTEYGLDTISTGNICAFAMELFERGIISTKETGGLQLNFGNEDALIELVHLIGKREGIGEILGEGVKAAARRFGKGAEACALHVKGMELPGYDPRGAKSQGLAYATSPRGGCHHTGYAEQELYDPSFDRFTIEGKAEITKNNQDKSALYDSTGICAFPTQLGVVNLETMAKLLYNATGFEEVDSPEKLTSLGERIFNLERLFNWREGMKQEDDTLPERFLKEPLREGASKGEVVDITKLLKEFYRVRGWDAGGKPANELIERLEIS